MFYVRGRIVTPKDVFPGFVRIEGERITGIDTKAADIGKVYDFGSWLVLPGFIDMHLHGVGEHTIFDMNSITGAAFEQIRHGTTGFLPAAASVSEERYIEFGRNVRQAQQRWKGGCARIFGAEFEGPFINPEYKGGMNARYLRPMDTAECTRYIDAVGDVLRVMTLSPELPNSQEVIRYLAGHNITVSAGHSCADEDEICSAIAAGLSNVCHLFNTFLRPADIESGRIDKAVVEKLLADERLSCQVICDMHHVLPQWVKFAIGLLSPNRFIAVTDSMAGAGLAGGEYMMTNGRKFTTKNGTARLVADGTLVGSVITMNHVFANLIEKCDVSLCDAARFTSTNPARVLKVDGEIGSIESTRRADLAVLDSKYNCVSTFIDGKIVYSN
ncbi:MAG: N-acetylglucosamine-6-phosphate deacetylase [Planctomycetota bacterium]